MPHVLYTLEAVICWSVMRWDFMPRGSEQPAMLKYTVTQQFIDTVKGKGPEMKQAPKQTKQMCQADVLTPKQWFLRFSTTLIGLPRFP